MKKCSICNEDKENIYFSVGYKMCKSCKSKRNAEWNKNHPESVKKSNKKYRSSHENKYKYSFYKNKYSKYGIGMRSISRLGLKLTLEIYDRYNRKCVGCQSESNLTIHHKDGKGRNYTELGLKPNNSIDNLVLLCRKCHGSIHGKQGGRTPKK